MEIFTLSKKTWYENTCAHGKQIEQHFRHLFYVPTNSEYPAACWSTYAVEIFIFQNQIFNPDIRQSY